MFNVIIIGAEDTQNYDFFKNKTIKLLSDKAKIHERIRILTTGDSYVEKFAKRYGIETLFFKTDWLSFGKEALKYRNSDMIKQANAIIFFQNNKKDSQMLFNESKKNGILHRIIQIK